MTENSPMTFNATAVARANSGYHRGEPGWYVVNYTTDFAVAGPFPSRLGAEADRRERNARYPQGPDDLVIVEHEDHGHA